MNTKRIAAGLMIVAALAAPAIVSAAGAPQPRVIEIAARKYHFTPARLVLKKGETVKLVLTSLDRGHGFLLKPFGIDAEIEPGQPATVTITPQTAGTFTAICDDYCGLGHNFMRMTIVVE